MKYVVLAILLISNNSWASPSEEPPEPLVPILETAQEFVGDDVNSVANRLDSFFGTQRADDELGRSTIRVRSLYTISEREKGDIDNQFRFNMILPRLEEKVRINYFKSKKTEIKQAGEKTPGFVLPTGTLNPKLNTKWEFRSDAGINVSFPPDVFIRGRLRKNIKMGTVIGRFVEELGWFSDQDWINTNSLNFDQSISKNILFRFANEGTWKIIPRKFDTSHGPSILQQFSDEIAMSYDFRVTSIAKRTLWYLSNLQVSTTFRQDIYKGIVYFNVTPGVNFPKDYNFRRTDFIFFQLEALFGRK